MLAASAGKLLKTIKEVGKFMKNLGTALLVFGLLLFVGGAALLIRGLTLASPATGRADAECQRAEELARLAEQQAREAETERDTVRKMDLQLEARRNAERARSARSLCFTFRDTEQKERLLRIAGFVFLSFVGLLLSIAGFFIRRKQRTA